MGSAVVYTIPMKKFGIRYPDGVEPSHTVVCYHKILFNAEYLGREPPNLNFKSQNNKLLKDYYFFIHIETIYVYYFKMLSKTQGKMLVVIKNNVFMLPARPHRSCAGCMKNLGFGQHFKVVDIDCFCMDKEVAVFQ